MCLCLAIFGCLTALMGQSLPGNETTIRGEITGERQIAGTTLSVELVYGSRVVALAQVMPDGRFELRGVAAGQYELRVTDTSQMVIHDQFVSVHDPVEGVTVRLDADQRARPPQGTVSMYSLLHPPPSGARKEFAKAAKAAAKGASDESLRHLRRALAIFPNYVEAHNDLGVWYMKRHDFTQAAAEFQTAAALDPAAVRPTANLALAWAVLGRGNDAELAARRVMNNDPGSPLARQVFEFVMKSRSLSK